MDNQAVDPAIFREHNFIFTTSENLAPQYLILTNPSLSFLVYQESVFDPGTTQQADNLSINTGMNPLIGPQLFFPTYHNTASFNPKTQQGAFSNIRAVIDPLINPSLPPTNPKTQRVANSGISANISPSINPLSLFPTSHNTLLPVMIFFLSHIFFLVSIV